MGTLITTGIVSLDGYIEDSAGRFDWSAPDEEVHRFVNDLERSVHTYLYGRRMYEVMSYWETAQQQPGQPEYALDYARVWQAARKVVYSRTLGEVSTTNTRLEREFVPAAVEQLKRSVDHELSIDGPNLAAAAIRAGLVDEFRMLVCPVVVGGGKPFLPDDVRLDLELLAERRFANGVVFLRYAIRGGS